MKGHDFYPGLFFMGVSIGACILALRLGLGSIRNPGAGLIPFGTGTVLGLMSMGMVVGSIARYLRATPENNAFKGIIWKAPILVVCTLLGYGIAFNTLGFPICTFLLMIILLVVVGRKKLWPSLAISVLTAVGAYLLFVTWLGCPFPVGPFGL